MTTLHTDRLTLKAFDAPLAALQRDDGAAFFQALGVPPAAAWPPEPFDDEAVDWVCEGLARDTDGVGWYGWAVLVTPHGTDAPRLAGAAALIGRPDFDGEVELAFGLCPEVQGNGYAGETIAALSAWALEHGAERVVVHIAEDHVSGARALMRNGFVDAKRPPYPGVSRWVLTGRPGAGRSA
jgi:RimJ/RimL family protein N-acetyltransferase